MRSSKVTTEQLVERTSLSESTITRLRTRESDNYKMDHVVLQLFIGIGVNCVIAVEHYSLCHDIPFTVIVDHRKPCAAVVLKGRCAVGTLFTLDAFAHSSLNLLDIFGDLNAFSRVFRP